MNFSELWGRAQWAGWQARERVTVAVQSSRPLLNVILIAVAACVLGYCLAWWTAREHVNAEWRHKITAASAAVREAVAAADTEVALTDDEIIKRLGDTDAQLKQAERALELARQDRSEIAGCPALPTRCYRVRGDAGGQ